MKEKGDIVKICELQEICPNKRNLLREQSTPDYLKGKTLEDIYGCSVLSSIQSYIRRCKVTVMTGGNDSLIFNLQEKM